MSYLILCLGLLLSLAACQPGGGLPIQDVKSYFYPLDSLDEGWVYAYRYEGAAEQPLEYWYYKRVPDLRDAPFLISTQYDEQGEQRAILRELLLPLGAQPKSYTIFQNDSLGNLLSRQVKLDSTRYNFPFRLVLSDTIYYPGELSFSLWPDTTLTITRQTYRYFGGWTEFSYNGRKHKALRLNSWVKQSMVDETKGGNWTMDSIPGYEIWAQGLGLVERQVDLRAHQGQLQTMRLQQIYTMDEFLSLKGAKLED